MQAFAPLSKPQVDEDIPDRFLYILGCLATGCGVEAGSWRAFRHQPPRAAAATGSAETLQQTRQSLAASHEATPSPSASVPVQPSSQVLPYPKLLVRCC